MARPTRSPQEPAGPPPGGDDRATWPQTLLLAGGACALFALLGRQAMHGYDAYRALVSVETGVGEAPGHFLYYPLGRLWWAGCQLLGGAAGVEVEAHGALRALSAVGAALGVGFAHRAALTLGARAGDAAWLAVAAAALPVTIYVAGVVEVDAVLLGTAGAVWWSLAHLAVRPTWVGAARTGALTGVAAGLHGGGQLLAAAAAAALGAWSLQRRRDPAGAADRPPALPPRRAAALIAVALGVHAGLYLAMSWLAGRDGQATMVANTFALGLSPQRLPATLWRDWLVPFAPWSVLWLGAFTVRALRLPALGFAACLLVYLLLTNVVMGYFESIGPPLDEHGAFMVGIALPTVALGGAWLSRRRRALGTAVALAVALGIARGDDWAPMPPTFARDVRALTAARDVELWTSGLAREYGWIRKHVHDVPAHAVGMITLEIQQRQRQGFAVDEQRLAIWFDSQVARLRAAGRELAITADGLRELESSTDPRLRWLAAEHLPARYRLEPIASGALRAVVLAPR